MVVVVSSREREKKREKEVKNKLALLRLNRVGISILVRSLETAVPKKAWWWWREPPFLVQSKPNRQVV